MKDEVMDLFYLMNDFDVIDSIAEDAIESEGEYRQEIKIAIDDIGTYALRLEAEVKALKLKYEPILKIINDKIKRADKKREWAENQLKSLIVPSLESSHTSEAVDIFYTKSEGVKILDRAKVPLELCETKIEPKLSLIKDRLANKEEVPGVELETRFNLQIKLGGPSACKNAEARTKRRLKGSAE